MTGEQLIVVVLLVAAFAAGWFARGGRRTDGSLDDAVRAYASVMSLWLAEGAHISPAGRLALETLQSQAQALGPAAPGSREAALQQAVELLAPYGHGEALDPATSRALEPLEDRLGVD